MSLCGVALLLLVGCGKSGTSSSGTSATVSTSTRAASVADQSSFASSISAMSKGDMYLVDLSSGAKTLDFSASGGSAQYVLMVQSKKSAAGSASVTVGDQSVVLGGMDKNIASPGLGDSLDADAQFDALLREAEANLTVDVAQESVRAHATKSHAKSISVGSSKTFRVLSSLASTGAYQTVTATAKCVNTTIVLYLDDEAPTALTADQISTLCTQFAQGLTTEYSILGAAPDINGDGVVAILMTPVVNRIGGSLGGIVTGFFWGGDLSTSGSGNPSSNFQEVVYTLIPDPSGQYGTQIPSDFAMANLLPAVVPHEVQHLISYYNHVFVNGGTAEATWLNEAMSHLIEDVVGFGQENPSREELFLASTEDTALITSGAPGLTERGASYMFMRFLYEQASDGAAFLRAVDATSQTGVSNILQAFAGPAGMDSWDAMLLHWGVAVVLTNADVTSDAHYIYTARTQNTTTGHWEGVCVHCDTEDGRGTTLAGPSLLSLASLGSTRLLAGSAAYIDLSAPPASLAVTPSSSADIQAVLIRTQ